MTISKAREGRRKIQSDCVVLRQRINSKFSICPLSIQHHLMLFSTLCPHQSPNTQNSRLLHAHPFYSFKVQLHMIKSCKCASFLPGWVNDLSLQPYNLYSVDTLGNSSQYTINLQISSHHSLGYTCLKQTVWFLLNLFPASSTVPADLYILSNPSGHTETIRRRSTRRKLMEISDHEVTQSSKVFTNWIQDKPLIHIVKYLYPEWKA